MTIPSSQASAATGSNGAADSIANINSPEVSNSRLTPATNPEITCRASLVSSKGSRISSGTPAATGIIFRSSPRIAGFVPTLT